MGMGEKHFVIRYSGDKIDEGWFDSEEDARETAELNLVVEEV